MDQCKRSGGFNGTVSFIVSGLPSGVIYGFSPNPGGSGHMATVESSNNVAAGLSNHREGTTGNQSATTSVSLIVPSSASSHFPGRLPIALTQGNYNGGQIQHYGSADSTAGVDAQRIRSSHRGECRFCDQSVDDWFPDRVRCRHVNTARIVSRDDYRNFGAHSVPARLFPWW